MKQEKSVKLICDGSSECWSLCKKKKEEAQVNSRLKKKKNVSENCASQRLRDGKKGRIQLFFFLLCVSCGKEEPNNNNNKWAHYFWTIYYFLTCFDRFSSLCSSQFNCACPGKKKKDRTCFLTAGFRRLWQLDGKGRIIIIKKEQKKKAPVLKKKKIGASS